MGQRSFTIISVTVESEIIYEVSCIVLVLGVLEISEDWSGHRIVCIQIDKMGFETIIRPVFLVQLPRLSYNLNILIWPEIKNLTYCKLLNCN